MIVAAVAASMLRYTRFRRSSTLRFGSIGCKVFEGYLKALT